MSIKSYSALDVPPPRVTESPKGGIIDFCSPLELPVVSPWALAIMVITLPPIPALPLRFLLRRITEPIVFRERLSNPPEAVLYCTPPVPTISG